MTFGELKELVAEFEGLDNDVVIVTPHPDTYRLVDFFMFGPGIAGRDEKNKQCSPDDAHEKVLLVYTDIE